MLGRGGIYTQECVAEGYIGADFGIREDLTNNLPDTFKAFNACYIPIFLAAHPDKKSRSRFGLRNVVDYLPGIGDKRCRYIARRQRRIQSFTHHPPRT